jgi:hypothetical protein
VVHLLLDQQSLRQANINVAIDNGNARAVLRGLESYAPIALWVSTVDSSEAMRIVHTHHAPDTEIFS